MPTQKWLARDFLGLTPAIDSRRSEQLYAIGGKNFVFDSKGPKSVFGSDLVLPYPVGDARFMQGIRLKLRGGDRVFHFMPDGIYEWVESTGFWKLIYPTPNTANAPYRWTWGYLNELLYFCHPQTGILVYDPATGVCGRNVGPGVPSQALAITVNNGRLVVIDPLFEYWSDQSNGLDFTPKLGGAGFQKISDRVSGFPKMITSYTQGVLVWTTGGVMRSEFTADAAVYRHRALNTEYRLVNPFCSVKIDDDTVVVLDERGLFQTRGEAPTPFAPLFNEFLIDYLQRIDVKIGENVRLEWDDLQRLMFVSVSQSYADPLYEQCFVLYPPLDKWGVFSKPHYGIFPFLIEGSDRADDYYGYVDSSNRVRVWRDNGYQEILPVDTSLNLVVPPVQKPAAEDSTNSGVVLSTSVTFNTLATTPMPRAGYYPRDGFAVAPANQAGLDAFVHIGLVRFTELQESNDQMAEVTQLAIGSILTGDANAPRTDFNLVPPGFDEDYAVASGAEDYGIESMNYVNHGVRLIGTNDGTSTFTVETPALVQIQRGLRHYACSVTGIWHILEMSAVNPGERFHLQSLELTGVYAGKLL